MDSRNNVDGVSAPQFIKVGPCTVVKAAISDCELRWDVYELPGGKCETFPAMSIWSLTKWVGVRVGNVAVGALVGHMCRLGVECRATELYWWFVGCKMFDDNEGTGVFGRVFKSAYSPGLADSASRLTRMINLKTMISVWNPRGTSGSGGFLVA